MVFGFLQNFAKLKKIFPSAKNKILFARIFSSSSGTSFRLPLPLIYLREKHAVAFEVEI